MNTEKVAVEEYVEKPQAHADQKTINFVFFELKSFWANIVFALIFILGEVGETVTLPLWLSAVDNTEKNLTSTTLKDGKMDGYFVLSFASFSFVIIFGFIIVVTKIFFPRTLGRTEKSFPHRLLFAAGMCDALNGALIVFACPPYRTAPYLQAILGNFMIPLTMFARLIILKKRPTLRKFICGMAVLFALFACLLPSIFPEQLEPDKSQEKGEGASGTKGALWSLCFMMGFVPAALMNVVQEKGLKMQNFLSRRGVNIIYFFFWETVYQLLWVTVLFWLDIVPGFGFVDNISQFGKNWWFSLRCYFGSAGCNSTPGVSGTLFILMYLFSNLGGGLLLRYSEGATLLAIVSSPVTPLSFIFWTLFKPQPLKFSPEFHNSTYYSMGALIIMIPSLYFYKTGPPEVDIKISQGPRKLNEHNSDPSEEDPLINKKTRASSDDKQDDIYA